MGVNPNVQHEVGAQRTAPNGNDIGGYWPQTLWSYWVQIEGRRNFFDAAIDLLRTFEMQKDFFRRIRSEGGMVAVYLDLNGCENFGDVISVENIQYVASLGVELGVELFPG
jgi:hypothetical protein